MLADLLAWSSAAEARPLISHWRTSTGAEVDFVVELPEKLLPIEVKAAERIRSDDARHLRIFLADYPEQAPGGMLLYGGDEVIRLDRNILAAPWHRVV